MKAKKTTKTQTAAKTFTDEQLLVIAKRFLKYAFVDIEYIWDNLTEMEKRFCTQEEFDALVRWMKEPIPVEIPDTEECSLCDMPDGEHTDDCPNNEDEPVWTPPTKLVYKGTGRAVKVGDVLLDGDGKTKWFVRGWQEPHKPEASGRVTVSEIHRRGPKRQVAMHESTFYVTVFDLKFVPKGGR